MRRRAMVTLPILLPAFRLPKVMRQLGSNLRDGFDRPFPKKLGRAPDRPSGNFQRTSSHAQVLSSACGLNVPTRKSSFNL